MSGQFPALSLKDKRVQECLPPGSSYIDRKRRKKQFYHDLLRVSFRGGWGNKFGESHPALACSKLLLLQGVHISRNQSLT